MAIRLINYDIVLHFNNRTKMAFLSTFKLCKQVNISITVRQLIVQHRQYFSIRYMNSYLILSLRYFEELVDLGAPVDGSKWR